MAGIKQFKEPMSRNHQNRRQLHLSANYLDLDPARLYFDFPNWSRQVACPIPHFSLQEITRNRQICLPTPQSLPSRSALPQLISIYNPIQSSHDPHLQPL